MATQKKGKPIPAIVAASKDDAAAWLTAHNVAESDVHVVTPSSKIPANANVSRVHLTRGMVGHPDRTKIVRTVRDRIGADPAADDAAE